MKLIFVFVTLLSLHQRPVNACGIECIFGMIKDYLEAFAELEDQVNENTVQIENNSVSCVCAAIEFIFL